MKGCQRGKCIKSIGLFRQHWRSTHLPQVLTYGCAVRGCGQKRRRQTDLNSHMRMLQVFQSRTAVRDYSASGVLVAEVVTNPVPVTTKKAKGKEREPCHLISWRRRQGHQPCTLRTAWWQVPRTQKPPSLETPPPTPTVKPASASSPNDKQPTPKLMEALPLGATGLIHQHDQLMRMLHQANKDEMDVRRKKEELKKELKNVEHTSSKSGLERPNTRKGQLGNRPSV